MFGDLQCEVFGGSDSASDQDYPPLEPRLDSSLGLRYSHTSSLPRPADSRHRAPTNGKLDHLCLGMSFPFGQATQAPWNNGKPEYQCQRTIQRPYSRLPLFNLKLSSLTIPFTLRVGQTIPIFTLVVAQESSTSSSSHHLLHI